jgi:hypothetical protein
METQNVTPDNSGHYAVQLGATSANGLPADLFVSGDARWLAVQVSGHAEQARVMLVAVPYALKAKDAETIGGCRLRPSCRPGRVLPSWPVTSRLDRSLPRGASLL